MQQKCSIYHRHVQMTYEIHELAYDADEEFERSSTVARPGSIASMSAEASQDSSRCWHPSVVSTSDRSRYRPLSLSLVEDADRELTVRVNAVPRYNYR